MDSSLERFLRYVKIDTQADGDSGTTPSSEKQKDLGRLLVDELKALGLEDAMMDKWGNVYAHLKGEGDKIGFNAHMDTALEVTDTNVNPRVIYNYDGGDIKLNEKYILSPNEFPRLINSKGKTLVVTDGNTLLGADDKAGIGIIMSALEYLHNHPEIKHHNISVCFTVDEEIGEGPLHFDYQKMDADYAVSFDGADPAVISYMNFNAYGVNIKIKGFSVHPGEGKDTLVNASFLLNQLLKSLPENETPYDSEDAEGYWHINNIKGDVEYAEADLILRDFNKKDISRYKAIIDKNSEFLQEKYKTSKITVEYYEQYTNMEEYVAKDPRALNVAIAAIKKNGLTPVLDRIRGGTDGATFSKNGLVTPNLGTGSYNHHGRFEYLVFEEYQKLIDICLDIMKI